MRRPELGPELVVRWWGMGRRSSENIVEEDFIFVVLELSRLVSSLRVTETLREVPKRAFGVFDCG